MTEIQLMRLALRLARRGYGSTSPNPMVGAVLVKNDRIIGRGWHRRAGLPHAEIEALRDAHRHGHSPRGATLYVTLEPCCTHGRTPPCTDAIIASGIRRVVVGATDPNPKHAGTGLRILRRAGIEVVAVGEGKARHSKRTGPRPLNTRRARSNTPCDALAMECTRLNEAFNHWIVHHTPFVTVKAAMTMDGKIATAAGESKWITGERARAYGMKLRQGSDAILVGVNTVLADDPSLTIRRQPAEGGNHEKAKPVRRIILDSLARTPLNAKVASDAHRSLTTIVVSKRAPRKRTAALATRVSVLVAPVAKSAIGLRRSAIDLPWLLNWLGSEKITSLLVEGGGEVNASFLLGGYAQRVAFFYASKILGGRDARPVVAGSGTSSVAHLPVLREVEWRKLGQDLLLQARLG